MVRRFAMRSLYFKLFLQSVLDGLAPLHPTLNHANRIQRIVSQITLNKSAVFRKRILSIWSLLVSKNISIIAASFQLRIRQHTLRNMFSYGYKNSCIFWTHPPPIFLQQSFFV